MNWFFIPLSVAALSVTSLSPCFAHSKNLAYGLDNAQSFHSQTKGNFFIQAGFFSHKSNASHYQHLLQSQTKHPVTISHQRQGYSVLIGPMHSAHELRTTAKTLAHASRKKNPVNRNRLKKPSGEVRPTVVIGSPASPMLNANWFLAFGTGLEFPTVHNDMYANNGSSFPAPYDRDLYSSQQSTTALLNLSAGRRWERQEQWLPAYSLGLFYQHSFVNNASGTVTQYSLPQFLNYTYNWNLSSDIVLASSKVNLYAKNRFLPYVTAGIGVAFNHSDYNEVPLPGVTPRTSPGFSANRCQFAYNAGAGIDYRATNQLILNAGYLYQNLGKISGQGLGTWSDTSLALGSYGLNEVVVGFTYLLDK